MKKTAITLLINKFRAAWNLMEHYSENNIPSQMNPVNSLLRLILMKSWACSSILVQALDKPEDHGFEIQ
jgi:hypothetical protein